MRKTRSPVLDAVYETAQGLHDANIMDKVTMRELDRLCLRQDLARAEAAKGFEQLHQGKLAPLDINRAKKNAVANAKAGRKVLPR